MDFTDIMRSVRAGDVAAGVIIHEGQLTYEDEGFALLMDFGEEFGRRHDGLPLPLGVNCVRADLDQDLKVEIAKAYLQSVRIALTQRRAAVEYSMQFARGLSRSLADQFVGMYVNEDSLAFNKEIRQAVEILKEEYWNHDYATC
jgi:1,4-dihydroxy-6-naphthoate synthase